MDLSKTEILFISIAARLGNAVYDFGNYNDKQFKKRYGITKKGANTLLEKLEVKCEAEFINGASHRKKDSSAYVKRSLYEELQKQYDMLKKDYDTLWEGVGLSKEINYGNLPRVIPTKQPVYGTATPEAYDGKRLDGITYDEPTQYASPEAKEAFNSFNKAIKKDFAVQVLAESEMPPTIEAKAVNSPIVEEGSIEQSKFKNKYEKNKRRRNA